MARGPRESNELVGRRGDLDPLGGDEAAEPETRKLITLMAGLLLEVITGTTKVEVSSALPIPVFIGLGDSG